MKIQILSDLHTEFDDYTFDVPVTDADILVLAGDIGVGTVRLAVWLRNQIAKHNKPVIFIPGNHEYYQNVIQDVDDFYEKMSLQTHNFYFLQNKSTVIDNVLFAGGTLWTDFNNNTYSTKRIVEKSLNDYRLIKHSRPSSIPERGIVKRRIIAQDTFEIHQTHKSAIIEALNTNWEKKVVVTHHAPSNLSTPDRYKHDFHLNGGYSSKLDSLVRNSTLWIHGHTHDSFNYEIGEGRVICNPRGYYDNAINPNFRSDLVVEI